MIYAFLLDQNPVSGVLGMGWGPRSFLAQLGSISHGKFSYCITANNTHDTYLSRRKNLPVVTFHSENADIEVKPEAIFLFREFEGKNVFCLSMLSDDSKTIIGAYQQMKQKFVYDTKARVLSFGPEDCEKNDRDCNFLCFSIWVMIPSYL
ncbi:hypothetical protein NC652_000350 [Populus alba x Populus x berolinensis]|nr:hypothetical protein NC652_000350 [Populus alba x Populus x berolinensis]